MSACAASRSFRRTDVDKLVPKCNLTLFLFAPFSWFYSCFSAPRRSNRLRRRRRHRFRSSNSAAVVRYFVLLTFHSAIVQRVICEAVCVAARRCVRLCFVANRYPLVTKIATERHTYIMVFTNWLYRNLMHYMYNIFR